MYLFASSYHFLGQYLSSKNFCLQTSNTKHKNKKIKIKTEQIRPHEFDYFLCLQLATLRRTKAKNYCLNTSLNLHSRGQMAKKAFS